MNWPGTYDRTPAKSMTGAQQQAAWDFVQNCGGLLTLQNSRGIYLDYAPGDLAKAERGEEAGSKSAPLPVTPSEGPR